ncbi:MAG: peptide ABC transporter substrate-binding protein [Treponema sp.]|jgi:peptide/nickel transport system substrate-binding protein/oligopeptide transport system substrate-binding protein|nr:peptide ABC transporter substrate-binding protein [Treponema sp.]
MKKMLIIAGLLFTAKLFAQEVPDYAETRPRAQIRDQLTVVFSTDNVELDVRKSFLASEAQIFTALYEGLYTYQPVTMSPVRALAQRSDLSRDKKVWTFTLREDAKYWNGDPVQAEDFRSAWLSLLDPSRNSPYSSLFDIIEGAREFRTGQLKDPSKVGISADGKILTVRLVSPAAFFPSMLCHHSFSPIHPSMLNNPDWSRQSPLSNGPFYIREQTEDTFVLVKNPYYWDLANVALNTLMFKFTDDAMLSSAMWNTGEARWIAGDVAIDALTDRSGITVNTLFATYYYFIRSAAPPWNDYRVRRALALAVPWKEIRSIYMQPAKTLIYPFSGYPSINGLDTTDSEEATRLLAEAGFPQGFGLPELVIKITPSQDAQRIVGLMVSEWAELGVPVRVTVIPYNQYFDSLKKDDYTIGATSWIGDFADPYTFLQMWRHDSNLNDAKHNDSDYETLLEQSMVLEGEQRLKVLSEAEQLLLDRGSVLPIYHNPALNIIDTSELDGWFPNVLDIHPFKYINFKKLKPLPGVVLFQNNVR